MAYTTVTEAQIVANLINTYSAMVMDVDDINPGSSTRSTFEAFAMELKKLYQSIGVNAADTQKMALYTMLNFSLLPAQAAYTMITATVLNAPSIDVKIPSGTTVSVPGTSIQYKTPADMTWPANASTVSLRVVCTQTGTIGNQRANTIIQLSTPIPGLQNVTVTNPKDVVTGTDLETEDQRANRFQQWVNSLHRGDDRAIVYGAKQAQIIDEYGFISEQVIKAQLVKGAGLNTIYIDNGTYDTSQALVSQCQQMMDGYVDANGNYQPGYTAAGITTTAQVAQLQQVSIIVTAAPMPGYTFDMIQQTIIDNVTKLVQSLNVGEALTEFALDAVIGNTPGVQRFQVVSPIEDVTPTDGTLLQLAPNQPSVSAM